jgi:hypothetical protein
MIDTPLFAHSNIRTHRIEIIPQSKRLFARREVTHRSASRTELLQANEMIATC